MCTPGPFSFTNPKELMARLSRKHKNTIVNVISRWAESYAGVRPVNHDRIRELINVAYRQKKRSVRVKSRNPRNRWKEVRLGDPKIHFLRSPVAMQIAQAVVRGRIGKAAAEALCVNYGIDKSFVANLRRDPMITSFGHHHWYRGSSALSDVWEATIQEASKNAQQAAFEPRPDADDDSPRGKELTRAYRRFTKYFPDRPGLSKVKDIQYLQNNHFRMVKSDRKIVNGNAVYTMGDFACNDFAAADNQQLLDVPWSGNADNATLNRCERASPGGYGSNYMDAEIAYKLFGIKDLTQIWAYELMHEAHVVMMFQSQTLVLAERPTLHTNADGELHNDEGPAVHWADGAKQYYIDGHALGAIGEFVVERPNELTLAHINQEENEEVKRIAIDKFGWGRYLEEIGATVVDRRDNAVDNTIEALVNIRTKVKRRQWGLSGAVQEVDLNQRKLILSCRSTARQYFLAVPEDTRSCEAGQRWMAEGANTRHVSALNHPVRVIGAS